MRRTIAFFLFSVAAALGSDCDIKFTLTNTNPGKSDNVVINNKGTACYSWQVTDFVNGFSAVSLVFESAIDVGGVPGAFSTFAGTIVAPGVNPTTSTTTATNLYTGAFPWIRIRLASSTGSGQVTGRILGAQATSATLIPGAFQATTSGNAVFGTFTVPTLSNFSFVSQTNATAANAADGTGIVVTILHGTGADFANTLCATATLPAPPYTVTLAFAYLFTGGGGNSESGMLLSGTGTDITEGWNYQALNWTNQDQCTTTSRASCTHIQNNTIVAMTPVTWEQVTDTGAARNWKQSIDGQTFTNINAGSGGNYANIVPNKACIQAYQNDTNFDFQVKLLSFKVCPNTTGVC